MKDLKTARESRGVTKTAVADHIGVTLKTYTKYENNPEEIKIDTAKKIADFLNIDVSDIFFFNDSK